MLPYYFSPSLRVPDTTIHKLILHRSRQADLPASTPISTSIPVHFGISRDDLTRGATSNATMILSAQMILTGLKPLVGGRVARQTVMPNPPICRKPHTASTSVENWTCENTAHTQLPPTQSPCFPQSTPAHRSVTLTRKRHRPTTHGRCLNTGPTILTESIAELARVHRAGLDSTIGTGTC
eukprot:SAG11_NODE_282_length_11247_cov_11.050323_6_plen_181_part_00